MTGNEEKPTPTPSEETQKEGSNVTTSQDQEDPVKRALKGDYKYWEAVQKAREVKNNS